LLALPAEETFVSESGKFMAPLLTTAQAAAHLGLTERTLALWREKSKDRGPRFYRLGRLVR